MTLEEFAGLLTKAKPKQFRPGPGYSACCPAHADKSPSFAVWESEGWLHFKCQTGCTEQEILQALNLTEEDRRIELREKQPAQRNPEYVYKSAEGNPIFRKVRFNKPEGKSFAIHAYRNGTWEKNAQSLNGERYTLYNLPAVKKAIQENRTVYLNEGEKACNLMTLHGLTGTCQPFGASETADKWHKDITSQLKGAHLVIVADRDAVGEGYARSVAEKVSSAVRSLRVVQSKTTSPKDDAYDHLNAGFTEEDWVERRDLTPIQFLGTDWVTLDQVHPEDVDWLFDRRFAKGMFSIIQGDPGEGKSTIARAMVAMITTGQSPAFWGMRLDGPRDVIWLTKEESLKYSVVPSLKRMGADLSRVHSLNVDADEEGRLPNFIFDDIGIAELRRKVEATRAVLVVCDPLIAFFSDKTDMHRQNETRATLSKVGRMAEMTECAAMGILHLNKGGSLNPLYRGIGSIDFQAYARTVFLVGHDPDDRDKKAFVQCKGNLGPWADAVGFSIEEDGQILWDEHSNLSAERICEQPNTKASRDKTAAATEWLENQLSFGPYLVSALVQRAKEQGFAKSILYESAAALNVARASQPTGERGRGPAWWAKKGYDWAHHVWPDPFA